MCIYIYVYVHIHIGVYRDRCIFAELLWGFHVSLREGTLKIFEVRIRAGRSRGMYWGLGFGGYLTLLVAKHEN